jgi:glyoxylase-like metal-dependent hydrolase (beta-lactamase superfamily II)
MYRFFNDNLGFVLLEPRTRALLAFDTGSFEASKKVIEEIESTHKGSRLKYIMTTHRHDDHCGGNMRWR